MRKAFIVALAVMSACTFTAIFDDTEADAAAGGAGSSSGGSHNGGRFRTRGGWGWRSYDLTQGQAPDFTEGADWNNIRNACRDYRFVIGFTLGHTLMDGVTPSGQPYVALWDVASVNPTPTLMSPLYQGYRGDSGSPWVPWNSARAMYNSLPIAERDGTNWVGLGANTASWFCYDSLGEASYSTRSHITLNRTNFDNGNYHAAGRTITVRPGQTIYWRHFVQNTGNKTGSFRTALSYRHGTAGYTTNALSGARTLNAGATFPSGITQQTVPNNAPDGSLYCQRYVVDRHSDSDTTDLFSAPACARVQADWSLRGQTDLRVNGGAYFTATRDVAPGDALYWRHRVFNNGPSTVDRTTQSSARGQGFSSPSDFNANLATSPAGTVMNGQVRSFASSYTVRPTDAGRNLCQRVGFWDAQRNSSGGDFSNWVCVNVPFNYSLTPSVDPLNNVVEPGSEVTVRSAVENSGPTISRPTQWQLSRVELAPGQAVPAGGSSASDPCSFFSSCQRADGGSNVTFDIGDRALPAAGHTETVGDIPVGTKICYAMSVQPSSHSTSNWQHSSLQCMIVGKKPKVQVWGGDVATRGEIRTSTTTKGSENYGSWGEYASISRELAVGFASGGGLADPSSPATNLNLLTFTNHSANLGNFTSSTYWARPLTLISDRLDAANGGSGIPGGSMSSWPSGTYRGGSMTLPGGEIPPGRSIVIVSSGTVTIGSDITYNSGSMGSISEIPQVVIIANDINIAGGVGQVDSWLLAPEGDVNTCSDEPVAAALTSSMCTNQLRINGPVVADKLHLRRTAGSGTGPQSGDPSEIINLRADAYIWAYLQSGGVGRAQTVLTTEKAPRY